MIVKDKSLMSKEMNDDVKRCTAKRKAPSLNHSTVTDLARFLGLSTSVPLTNATW